VDDDDDEEEDDEDVGEASSSRGAPNGVLEKEKILRTALVAVSKRMTNNFHCAFHLGLMYFRSQNYTKAKEAFKRALENLRAQRSKIVDEKRWGAMEARTVSLHAQCCLYELTAPGTTPTEEHNPADIQEQFVQATKIDNMQPDIWNNLGLLHMSLDKFEGARMILQPILSNFTQYNDAISNLGLSHLCSSELAEAAKSFQTVILRDSSHLEALNNYGVLLLRHKCYRNAVIFLEKAVDLDPSQSYVWNNLACAYSGEGRLQDAARAFRHARELDDGNVHATVNLAHHITCMVQAEGDAGASREKLAQAEHMYSSVLCEQQSCTQAWTGLAGLFKAQMDMAESEEAKAEFRSLAMEAFSQGVESDSNDPVVWSQLGLFSLAESDAKKGEVCFRTAIHKNRTILAAWVNLGLSMQLANVPSEACAMYVKALSTFRDSHEIYNNIANLYRHLGKYEEAMVSYQACLNIKDDYAIAHNNLALLHAARGSLDDAVFSLNKALQLDPGLDCAKSNLIKVKELQRRAQLAGEADTPQ